MTALWPVALCFVVLWAVVSPAGEACDFSLELEEVFCSSSELHMFRGFAIPTIHIELFSEPTSTFFSQAGYHIPGYHASIPEARLPRFPRLFCLNSLDSAASIPRARPSQ